MSRLTDAVVRHRQALLQRERQAATEMVRSYGNAWRSIKRDLDRLLARMQQARDAGEALEPVWLYQEGRLRDLLRQAEAKINEFSRFADETITEQQREAVAAALAQAQEIALLAMPPAPTASAALAVRVNWSHLPAEALDDLIGRLRNGSPLRELLDQPGPSASQAIAQGLVDGLAKGSHPTVIAREIRNSLGGDLQRALTISRTEVLRSYRGASQRAYQANDDLVKGWIWYAEIGSCCTACFAMHGTFHDLSEDLDGHVNCRCSMVPVTKDWGELGFLDTDDAEAPTDAIEEGADLWEDQPEARQLDLFGERGLAAMRNGDLEMSDWVQVRDSEAWGSSRTTATCRQALANAARRTGGG